MGDIENQKNEQMNSLQQMNQFNKGLYNNNNFGMPNHQMGNNFQQNYPNNNSYNNNNNNYNNNYNNGGYNNYGNNNDYYSEDSYDQYQQGSGKSLVGHDVRMKFVSKVYSILSVQIGFTCLMCFCAVVNESFSAFLKDRNNLWIFYTSLVMTLILSCVLACYQSAARKVPTNYILLFLFTFFESYIVASVCTFVPPQKVLMAALLTLAMFLALTVYAFTTKTDFTISGGLLFVCLFVFSFAGIFLLFTNSNFAHIFYCCIGVILFSIYIIYDTQLLMDNKQFSYDIDDYIIAALQLYLDIINIFIYLLEIFGRSD